MKNLRDAEPGTKPPAAITRARRFLEAAQAGPDTLAELLGAGTVEDTALFYAVDGFGAAKQLLAELLAVVDGLTAPGGEGGTR